MDFNITVTKENTDFFPDHFHKQWEIMCYTKGTGVLHTSNMEYAFCENTVIAVPPNTVHGSRSNAPFVNICIHADLQMPKNEIYCIGQANDRCREIFEIISFFAYNGKNYSTVVSRLIMAVQELVLADSGNETDAAVKRIYDKISENFQRCDFSLEGEIKKTGYSNDYFREKFKSCYNITPKKYLINKRIDYAKMLIDIYKNTLKVYEISAMCGYLDALYFSRIFKKYTGKSPEEYIKGELDNEKT